MSRAAAIIGGSMETIGIREASEQLETLVGRVAGGESFIMSNAGTPLVKVAPGRSRQGVPHTQLGFWQEKLPYLMTLIGWVRRIGYGSSEENHYERLVCANAIHPKCCPGT